MEAPPFDVRLDADGDDVIVTVFGELDIEISAFSSALRTAVEDARQGVVLDLADLHFLDSFGVQVILTAQDHAAKRGLTFQVMNPNPIVRRVLEICGAMDPLQQ